MARAEQASHGYLMALIRTHGTLPRYEGHVLSILKHLGNRGIEEDVLDSLTKTTQEWFNREKI